MKIIPAIDIIGGKCVRLTQGDYSQKKVYNSDPVEMAKKYEANGIKYLHLVDLDGAKFKHVINYKILNEIALKTKLNIDFGGGISSNLDVKIAFENGASQISIGSVAVNKTSLFVSWLNKYGADKINLGADFKDRMVAINAWLNKSEIDILDFIKAYENIGVKNVVCTDINKDGMMQGASFEIYKEIIKNTNVNLIASGGVSSASDLIILKEIGCKGAIIGKAIYERKITLSEISALC